MAILAYWKFAVGAGIALLLSFWLHNWSVSRLEAKHKKELEAQVQFDIKKCEESKQPTKESNEHYQAIIAQRDADIIELSKRPKKCLYVSKPADNTQGTNSQSDKGNGLPSDVLYRFAGFCETDRAGLETLQQHLDKVRCELKR